MIDIKKMFSTIGIALIGVGAMATYSLINKNTRKSADKLINSMLDEANTLLKDMK